MLKPHIARAFIAALRSGKYKQTFGALRAGEDCFCAEGLLCHVIDPTRWENRIFYRFPDGLCVQAAIPGEIRSAIGQTFSLTGWNDVQRLTFAQIADKVEAIHKEIL